MPFAEDVDAVLDKHGFTRQSLTQELSKRAALHAVAVVGAKLYLRRTQPFYEPSNLVVGAVAYTAYHVSRNTHRYIRQQARMTKARINAEKG